MRIKIVLYKILGDYTLGSKVLTIPCGTGSLYNSEFQNRASVRIQNLF